jgi:DNA-binding SARP family transcriptional activator
MGADVYLKSKFDKQMAVHKPRFDAAVTVRDHLPEGSPERDKEQEKVMQAYNAMYAEGYYRDPYNDTTFLNKLGLSWWRDVIPMLDDDGNMPIEQARKFREQVATLPLIESEIATVFADEPRERVREYYETDRKILVALLDESIALNEPLHMSL